MILNNFRDAINDLTRSVDVQFKRIAQMQAGLDAIKRAWDKVFLP